MFSLPGCEWPVYRYQSDLCEECVAGGAKIVLILPKEKKILDIENQDVARANLGNLVEVLGTTDARGKTIHIASLRLLEEGIAACERPRLSK